MHICVNCNNFRRLEKPDSKKLTCYITIKAWQNMHKEKSRDKIKIHKKC